MTPKAKEIVARSFDSAQRLLPAIKQKANDPIENAKRSYTAVLASQYFALGVSKYLLERDASALRENLVRCVNLQIELCEAFDRGEAVSPSWVTWLNYKEVFYAFAAGEPDVARKMAGFLRTQKVNGRNQDHPFDRAMGRMVRAFVLDEEAEKPEALAGFQEIGEKKGIADFKGYGDFFERFLVGDATGMTAALARIAEGHAHQSKRGVFSQTLDAYICLWGLGAANFARLQGHAATCDNDLMPGELLVPVSPGRL